jgi:hypothetical protein
MSAAVMLSTIKNIRCKRRSTEVSGVERYTSRDLLVRGVDVEDAVVGVTNPYDF